MRCADGKPWRPANGTDGADWEASWCDHCIHDAPFRKDMERGEGCEILAYAGMGEQPAEWLWRNGEPICTDFKEDPANPLRCPFTMEMFP